MKYEDLLLQDLDCANEEKRNQLIQAATTFYVEMKSKMESGDPVKRKEAMERMTEVQALLTAKRNAICEKTGLTPEQLAIMSQHPRFRDSHEAITQAQEKIDLSLNPPHRPKLRRKKARVQV